MNEVLAGVILGAIFQLIISLIGMYLIISKNTARIEERIHSVEGSVTVKFESVKQFVELKLESMSKTHDNLNVRISKLEQFRDDFYGSHIYRSLITRRGGETPGD